MDPWHRSLWPLPIPQLDWLDLRNVNDSIMVQGQTRRGHHEKHQHNGRLPNIGLLVREEWRLLT